MGASVHASASMMGKGGSGGSVLCIPLYVHVTMLSWYLITELACPGEKVIWVYKCTISLRSGIMQGGIGGTRFFFLLICAH